MCKVSLLTLSVNKIPSHYMRYVNIKLNLLHNKVCKRYNEENGDESVNNFVDSQDLMVCEKAHSYIIVRQKNFISNALCFINFQCDVNSPDFFSNGDTILCGRKHYCFYLHMNNLFGYNCFLTIIIPYIWHETNKGKEKHIVYSNSLDLQVLWSKTENKILLSVQKA